MNPGEETGENLRRLADTVDELGFSFNLEYDKGQYILGVIDGPRAPFDEQNEDLDFLVNWAIETITTSY